MVLAYRPRGKSLGLDGLPYELYKTMLELFVGLLTKVYAVWPQDGKTPSSLSLGVVTLVRKDLSSRDRISNFRLVTLPNMELNILAKSVSKKIGDCCGESCRGGADMCHYGKDNPGQPLSYMLHFR